MTGTTEHTTHDRAGSLAMLDAGACEAHRGPIVVASGNGLAAAECAYTHVVEGRNPVRAVVEGVTLIENDPRDVSVGFGGLPNADGVVELDAAVMDGERHRCGAVAALQRVRHASRVALDVLEHCDHTLLVGEGALAFARSRGFSEEDLLTTEARAAYDRWRNAGAHTPRGDAAIRSDEDRWTHLDGDDPSDPDNLAPGIPYTHGTVYVGAVDAKGRTACCVSTSGLSYKLPGRVGDSPIIGAGLFADDHGTAGATGRGESTLDHGAARLACFLIERGDPPTEACKWVLERIAERTLDPRLCESKGRPRFNVTMYAVRRDGAFGAAAMHPGYSVAVCDEVGPRRLATASVFD